MRCSGEARPKSWMVLSGERTKELMGKVKLGNNELETDSK